MSPSRCGSAPRTPTGLRQYAQLNEAEAVIKLETAWGDAFANLILDPPPIAPPPEEDTDENGEADGEAQDADGDSDDSA